MVQIAPSMLAADFLHLEKDVELVNKHANISYGFPIVEAIAKKAEKTLDAHLMIIKPENYVERFAKVGVHMLSFHLNATENPGEVLSQIKALGMKAGLAINPDIPVESLFPYLAQCDYVLLMSVFAGFGGQKFIEETYDRVAAVKKEIDAQGLDCQIQVDGGVSAANAQKLIECGAEILVAGSAVFKAENPAGVIAAMKGE